MRVSEKNRDHFYQARTTMGIKRPAIIMNTALDENTRGLTYNYGPFSRVCINEYTDDYPINTIYHEMGHVYHNHHAASNASLKAAPIFWVMGILAYARKAIRPAIACSSTSVLASIMHHYLENDSLDASRVRECQAQEAAVLAMAKAGHTDLLNARVHFLQRVAQIESGSMRTRGEKYFTIDEEIAMIRAALEKKSG